MPKAKRLDTPIFAHDDPVEYIRAWSDYARRFGVTRKDLCRRAGFGAHAFLSDVISRRKKIGKKHIDGFITAFELSGDEAEYFRLLILRDSSRDSHEKEMLFRELGALRQKHLKKVLADKEMEYFASWRYPVIREYVLHKKRVCSPKEIVDDLIHLKLSSHEVAQALCKLEQWNLVRYDEKDQCWYPADDTQAISYTQMPHAVVNDVKRTILETSVHAMESMPAKDRHISIAIKGISRKTYERFCERIDELRRDFLEVNEHGREVDQVAAIGVQLFPLIHIPGPDREGSRE